MHVLCVRACVCACVCMRVCAEVWRSCIEPEGGGRVFSVRCKLVSLVRFSKRCRKGRVQAVNDGRLSIL